MSTSCTAIFGATDLLEALRRGAAADSEVIEVVTESPDAGEQVPPRNLDYRGTRRAPRFRMPECSEVQVHGPIAALVDLSRFGAQILFPAPLKPQQRVRMILGDDLGLAKFSASVAWASYEIPKGVSRYAFCRRHKS